MQQPQTLADLLGAPDPQTDAAARETAAQMERLAIIDGDYTDASDFADRVLRSRDFRRYVITALALGSLPSAVMLRLMDYAKGWGKPPEKHELTGADGKPLEIVTRVERVIVRPSQSVEDFTEIQKKDQPRSIH